MILKVQFVTFSDRLLLQYIQSKASHLGEVRLRYEEIARQTGMSYMTVRRAVCRLHDAGLISRQREPGDSYTYRVTNDECA